MEEMYFAWLENPQSVHKVGTPPCLLYGRAAPGAEGNWGEAACQLCDLGQVSLSSRSFVICV